MNTQAILAVFKRNLGSYFGSPSGYVFICAFLLASGLAAFWPQEFFDSNLANLDQLNKFLPHILLGFIPAITMSVWAEERRQGTDELLLTLPGSDLDVVTGKYLGLVSIFTVSLLVSFSANFLVLMQLGSPDFGLLFSTYVGYWFVGLTMLSIGMAASFLTANLTVAFVLGVAFNAPIALLPNSQWGVANNFLDFSRGIISFSGIVFFVGLAIAMIYLCSVLIGRRHWAGSQDGAVKALQFGVRFIATIVIAFSFTIFARNHDVRIDATAEQLSSLSNGSIDLLSDIEGVVEIDAFISPADAMPEQYVQTRINMLTALREIDRKSKNITIDVHVISVEDNASATAEKYGIENQNGVTPPLFVQEDGRFMPWQKDLYLGIVFKGNGGQQTIPFLYKGLPVEYEIMRNLNAVSGSKKKKKLGIFATDAPVMGAAGMGMMGISMGGGTPPWEVITELRKQYDVQEVTGGPIKKGDYDALMVVQPSTLDNAKLDELIAAIRAGIPTAIFEDPLPLIQGGVTGTYEARRNNQQGGPGQPPPTPPEKGDLNKLWDLLGVHFNVEPKVRLQTIRTQLSELSSIANNQLAPLRGRVPEITSFIAALDALVKKGNEFDARLQANAPMSKDDWDSLKLTSLRSSLDSLDYSHPFRRNIEEQLLSPAEKKMNGLSQLILRDPHNPFPKIPRSENFPDEFVYVGGTEGSFADGPVTSQLQYCLFTCPGSLYEQGKNGFSFKPLLKTRGGQLAGTTGLENFWTGGMFGSPRRFNPDRTTYPGSGNSEVIAAAISGIVEDSNGTNNLDVILVADLDVLADPFYNIRSRGPDAEFPLDVDNVTFSLNLIDQLADEESLLDIRNRRRLHRTLEEFEESIEEARTVASTTIKDAESSMQKILQDENRKLNEALASVQQNNKGGMTQTQFMQVLQTEAAKLNKNMERRQRELRKESNAKIKDAERNRDALIRRMESKVQFMSVFLPPIPLLIIAVLVFVRKKTVEIQGANESRVRS